MLQYRNIVEKELESKLDQLLTFNLSDIDKYRVMGEVEIN